MGKYKSTSFVPSKHRIRIKPLSYQDQVTTTLKEKLSYFIIGIGVLLGLITGTSYFILKNTASHQIVAKRSQTNSIQITVAPTRTPTKVLTKIEKPKEVVTAPKVDPTKAALAAAAKPGIGASTYIVKAGDTLWKIAEKAYKSGFNYKDVVAYNKIQDPNTIIAGQTILLPTVVPDLPTDPTALAQGGVGGPSVQGEIGEGAMTTPVTNPASTYTVVKGDTLWSISEQSLGDGFSWHEIAKANNVSDPTKLEPGTVLQIPR